MYLAFGRQGVKALQSVYNFYMYFSVLFINQLQMQNTPVAHSSLMQKLWKLGLSDCAH